MSIPINQLDICPYIYPKHLMKPYTRNDPKSQNRLYLISSIYIYIPRNSQTPIKPKSPKIPAQTRFGISRVLCV